jgi:hypothetical protein
MRETTQAKAALIAQEKDKHKHKDAIQKLSGELGVPVEDVKKSYEEALELFKHATIKDYVSIFVSRSVKERLKHLQHTN